MARLGEVLTDNNLIEKFVTAVQEGEGHLYSSVVGGYNREMVMGRHQTIEQLLELMSIEFKLAQRTPDNTENMVDLSSAEECAHCKKLGHSADDCWVKHPNKQPGKNRVRPENESRKCFKYGKVGHLKRDCKHSGSTETILSSLKINENSSIDCYSRTYVDSACSCHTVTSLELLDEGTIQRANKAVKAVDGTIIPLTHKGRRTIRTRQGVITLGQVYYADGLKYNLISVPTMTQLGAEVTFGCNEAFITNSESRIPLRRIDGLWVLPEEEIKLGIASLRMERGGTTNAETWHRRLAHPSDNKLEQMIKSKAIPRNAAGFTAATCRTCQLTHPSRCPVPHTAERSGKVTVQVDYMPMGQTEKGWKGEVGAYIFSSRSSKLLKAYPVKNASTLDAVDSIEKYCKFVLPFLGEKVDCIQTDAGNQFTSQEWREVCTERGLTCRTCPVDHQAMNGQVERAIGILAAKMRALLLGMNMHKRYWPLAIEAAAYILNRTPHASLQNISPLEKSTGDKPDLKRCRVFGCKAHAQVPKAQRRGKLSRTAWEGVMAGYSISSPEWVILDPRSGKLRTVHSVTFNEDIPGLEHETRNSRKSEDIVEVRHLAPTTEGKPEAPHGPEGGRNSTSNSTHPQAEQEFENPGTTEGSANSGTYPQTAQEVNSPETSRSTHDSEEEIDEEITRLRVQEDQLLSLALGAAATIHPCNKEPKSWRKAIDAPHWKEAMMREKKELEDMGAWELVPRPPGITVLPGVWRFRIKRDENGDIALY